MNAPTSTAAHRLLDMVHEAGGELARRQDGGLIWVTEPGADVRRALETEIRQRFAEVSVLVTGWPCRFCRRLAELPDLCTGCHDLLRAYVANGGQFSAGKSCHHATSGDGFTACRLVVDHRLTVPFSTVQGGTFCRRCLANLLRRHNRRLA